MDQVEDLLVNVWYPWSASDREFLDVRAPGMFRDIPAQRGAVYEDRDEMDCRLNRIKAEKVQWCIDRLPRMQAVAVDLHCANRRGPAVWRNQRMTQEQAHEMYQQAKQAMLPDLMLKELIQREAA